MVELIETWRRQHKWTARTIARELHARGHRVSIATVGRWLVRLGINRRADIDPDGSTNRPAGKITARYPGHMVHLDAKKVGRTPDGGGWRAHGRGSHADKAAQQAKAKGAKAGHVHLHSAVDAYSRLAYTEHLPDEKATTAIAFFARARAFFARARAFFARARAFFAAHGITRLVRVITDNGLLLPLHSLRPHCARHRPPPADPPLHPRHNGKAERYNRTLTEKLLSGRSWTSEIEGATRNRTCVSNH